MRTARTRRLVRDIIYIYIRVLRLLMGCIGTPAPAEADAPSKEVTPAPGADEDGDDAEEGGPKILSKKEKERLKKEKEKVCSIDMYANSRHSKDT